MVRVVGGGGCGCSVIYLFVYLFLRYETDVKFLTVHIHLQFLLVRMVIVPKVREAGRRWEVFELIGVLF